MLFTSAFLHDGWIHFAGNMLYLWIFGDNVEDSLGHAGFAVFYLTAAAISAGAHAVLEPLLAGAADRRQRRHRRDLGVYFVLYPRSQVLTAVFLVLYLDVIEVPAVIFLGVWLVMQLAAGLASMGAGAADGGMAIGAHLAGFGVGPGGRPRAEAGAEETRLGGVDRLERTCEPANVEPASFAQL